MNCSTCKYWSGKRDLFTLELTGKGTCSCPKFVYNPYGDEMKDDELHYSDYEGYNATFETGKNFGCIHHSVR